MNILIGKLTPLNPNITSQNGFSVNLLSNDWNINGDISGLSLNDISGKTIIVSGNMKDLKNVYNGNIIVGGKVTFSKSNLSNAALINMCNITAEECSGGNIKIGNNVKINSNLIIEEMDITPNSILEIGGNLTYNSYIHMRDDTSKLIVNGDFIVGRYNTEARAAIAYNKAVDIVKKQGYDKNYDFNYIEGLSPAQYAQMYSECSISDKLYHLIL